MGIVVYVRAKADRASARRVDRSSRGQSLTVSALTIAIIAAFTGSDNAGQASTTVAKQGSMSSFSCAPIALSVARELGRVAKLLLSHSLCD